MKSSFTSVTGNTCCRSEARFLGFPQNLPLRFAVCPSVPLDRGRAHLDDSERVLLREVRQLRQKLAARAQEASATCCRSGLTTSSAPQ